MNSTTLNRILIASNVGLIAVIVFLFLGRPSSSPAAGKKSADVSQAKMPDAKGSVSRPYAAVLADSDWKSWVGTLRAAGVPAPVLAQLVREGFDEQWAKTRQAEAQAAYARGDIEAEGLAVVNMEHDIEQDAVLRAALGDEEFKKLDKQNVLGSMNLAAVQLTDAESDALYTLEKNYRGHLNDLQMAKLKHQLTPADYEAQQAAAKAQHDEQLKGLVGYKRYAIIQGIDTATADAGDLKRALGDSGIKSADVPFEQLLTSQQEYLQHRKEMEFRINEAKSQIVNCEQELQRTEDARTTELQRMLGSDETDAFERGQDERYKEMKRFADDWGLDDGSTDYLYRTIKYYEKVVADYQRQARAMEAQGQDVDWKALNYNIEVFGRQTEQAVREYLGNDRFDAIKQNKIFPFAAK